MEFRKMIESKAATALATIAVAVGGVAVSEGVAAANGPVNWGGCMSEVAGTAPGAPANYAPGRTDVGPLTVTPNGNQNTAQGFAGNMGCPTK